MSLAFAAQGTKLREVEIQGFVDDNNSSTTILDPVGVNVFTGTATDVLNCGIVFVTISTDVASATDGLSIQQSSDGTNWDHTDDYTVAAGANKNYSINPHSKWFRVVYTNGAVIQGHFRLQSVCKGNAKPSSHRIKDEIIGDDDCELVKSAITGENGDGLWHNVNVTSDGDLTISDNSDGLAIAEGNVTGKTFIHKFGFTPDFDISDGFVTVWDGAEDGGIDEMQYTYSTTAAIDSISSSNAGDTQTLEIHGLDSNYDIVVQTKSLNGQTRVAIDTSLIRVYRVVNRGSTNLAGDAYCFEDTPDVAPADGIPDDTTKIRAVINNGNNQTLMAVYTIPNGKTGYLRQYYCSLAGAKKTSVHVIHLDARPFGEVFQLKHVASLVAVGTSYIATVFVEPEVFQAKTDIEMQANSDEDQAAISAGFDIVLVDD